MYESTLKKAQCVRFAGWFLAKNAVLTLSETIWGSSIEPGATTNYNKRLTTMVDPD